MDADKIGSGQEIIQANQWNPLLGRCIRGYIRVISYHIHLQSLGPLRNEATDTTNADDAESLIIELQPHEFGPLPLSRFSGGVGLRDIPRHGQHHGNGMFGSRDGIFPRSVHHEDSPSRRCLQVDVIDPDSGTADYLELLRCVDNISSKPSLAPDNDTVILPNGCHQLAGAHISIHITPDLLLLLKGFYALGGQFISH